MSAAIPSLPQITHAEAVKRGWVTDPGPTITEAEFLDRPTDPRTEASFVAADMLVHWYRSGMGFREFEAVRAAVEGWEERR